MRNRFVLLAVLILALSVFCTEQKALAQGPRSIEDSSPQLVVNGMANKLARGVANVATGWLEFPKQIVMTSKEEGLAKGLLIGPIRGIGMTLGRTISGAGEALTFFIAYPGFFDPYFDPSYVWQTE